MKRFSILILTGVSGSGKTTVGRALARRLNVPFYEGDNYHTAHNIAKMSLGKPLTDADRAPWLARLHELIVNLNAHDKSAVIACSALQKAYREQLARGVPDAIFVYLKGSFDLIHARMRARDEHFFDATMLRSQFDALEPPTADEAVIVNIDASVEIIVDRICDRICDAP